MAVSPQPRVKEVILYDVENQRYASEYHNFPMQLNILNVPNGNIDSVITVFFAFAELKSNYTPTKTTVQRISLKHVSGNPKSAKNTTLYTDETTKYDSKFGIYP
ncbi:hypothetical protein SNE40_003360 [Patella caerulea]|uniref:Uncharacterized protein n=1 Tax=Patella caerulea TaxID=87958 RepID=A0AAN8KAJ3_PATCE